MLLLKKKQDEKSGNSEMFGYTSKFISDELEVIQDQQENLIRVSDELEKAFSQTESMKKLIKIVKKADKAILDKLGEKRKEESSMLNLMEEIKGLISNHRYEDIERLMLSVKKKSELKIRFSREELNLLRDIMSELDELYKEAYGLCRLYQLIYSNISSIYQRCEYELNTESSEGEELSRAGSYTEHIY